MNVIQYEGGKVPGPGCYVGIPIDDYHRDIAPGFSVSHSSLDRAFRQSPAHFWSRCYANPDREPDEPTEAMIIGRAAGWLFSGERNFQKHFIRRPDKAPDGRAWNGNNLTCIDWLASAERKGLTVIKPEQVKRIVGMKNALDKEPLIQAGILSGKIEHSLIYQCPETGLWVKARPDIIPNDSGDFADLKCVADISEDGISRLIGSLGYHRQAAMVCEAAHHCLGIPLKFRGHGEGEGMSFTFVFVESDRPHCVEICTLKPDEIEAGMHENRMARLLVKRCLDEGEWPGPTGRQRDARYVGLTKWAADANAYRVGQIKRMLAIGSTS